MALDMKKITSYFNSLRQAGIDLDEAFINQVFDKCNLQSIKRCQDVPRETMQGVLKGVCKGKDIKFTADQLDGILKALTHHCLHGNVDLKMWNACFLYWTRKLIECAYRYVAYFKAYFHLFKQDISDKSAFIIVDVQNDFISGTLALKNLPAKQDGAEVIPVINQLKKNANFDLIVFTLDWHPKDHCSYYTNVKKYPIHSSSKLKAEEAKMYDVVVYDGEKPQEQTLWPVHCEQGSWGAELHADLKVDSSDVLIYKGSSPNIDSYSAFWDNGKLSQTNLFTTLLKHKITKTFLCGLATDICVTYSVIDSANHGLKTFLIEDASRGVADASIADGKQKMLNAGATIINAPQVPHHL